MLDSRDKQVGSSTYRVTQLGATQSLTTLLDLAKMLGPALGVVVDGAGGHSASFADLANAQVTGAVFARATEALFSRLDNVKVQEIINKMREKTQVDREGNGNFQNLAPIFDVHFAGKMGELFGWFRFALEVNYSDFLPLLADLGRRESPAAARAPAL
jgi:hypothetical protein